ncbi:MAG TPA: nucleotidyltransferase family protein [Rhodopila sp.]
MRSSRTTLYCHFAVKHASTLRSILANDPVRWRALDLVASLGLADCWVGAGFVRNAVWDALHGRSPALLADDVDVLWFDPGQADPAVDKRGEASLRLLEPHLTWSVKNQARMHGRNGDAAYTSSADAMWYWPETATAVAVRRTGPDASDIAAPFGLDDLFALVVRPTPRFTGAKRDVYLTRIRTKNWRAQWPLLRIEAAEDA